MAAVLAPTERASAQSVPNVFWNSFSYSVIESEEAAFQYQTSQVSSANIDVSYTIGGTATCGVDYTIAGANCSARTGTFTIPALTLAFTSVGLAITALGDGVSDSGETVILTITDGADYNLGNGITTTITIFENTGRSAFRISGQPQVNSMLTGNRVCADTDGEGSLSYQWRRNANIVDPFIGRWHDISGATSQSYTLVQADSGQYLHLKVTYTDGKGLEESVYSQMVGPIGAAASANMVRFSRDDYNVREGDSLRPTLTFGSPTAQEQTFVIGFNTCDAELPEDINADASSGFQFGATDLFGATLSVTVPAGVTSHTFSLPVPLDGEIEEAESFVMGFHRVPSGIAIGDPADATSAGTQAHVQITDVNLVPENWALKPSGVSAGEQFRLLFKTGNERNAQSGDIGVYDTFVRTRTSAHPWHADIEAYADTFRVVGSTSAVDAAWHTATGIMVSGQPSHTPWSHPIHWLNGAKIADDYNDFWDGNWDDNAQTKGRHGDGLDHTNTRGPNTGTKTGTTHATAGTKANLYLGHSTNTRWGGGAANQNPINQGNIPVGSNNVYYGLSGIFLALDATPANPLVTIETRRARVTEGDAIRYTLRAVPAPSSPVTVSVKVTEPGGLPDFVDPRDHGKRDRIIPTSGVLTFTVRTLPDDKGEADGEVTVSIGAGSGYRTLAGSDTAMTAITDDDEASTLSASVALGNGSSGPARTGANVDFTFSLAAAREESDLEQIRTQLAWGGDVISPRSDRPTVWDEFWYHPQTRKMGGYVRPMLESSIIRGQRSFGLRVHVKNHAEAGGEVDDGWIAMRVDTDSADNYDAAPGAEWACMPVGSGTCPSAWPGVPTAAIVPLDKERNDHGHGRVRSGADARWRVTVTPAPAAGETRRVYLKTWEVFINAIDRPTLDDDHCELPAGVTVFDPDKHCDPPPRKGNRQVQFEAYAHVDVGSSGSAEFTMPTKAWRSTENMRGRNYLARVQEDVSYSLVDGSKQAEVRTTIFNPNELACWYGHAHYRARLVTVDGQQVYSVGGMGITECLTESELDEFLATHGSAGRVWTSCKVDYGHREHPHTDGNGNTHHHHHHNQNPPLRLGDGSCPGGQSQLDGGDSQDGQTDDPPENAFPDPGAMGFSDVTASGMTLSWPQREVDHYLVYWAENAENAETQSVEVDAGTLTHTLTGLKADTEYAVIVYSQDYDEVTPTAYQRTAAAAPASCDPITAGVAIERARAAFAWHTRHGSDAPLFWRILNTLGADNMPAKPSGVTDETVAAADVKTYSSGRGWGGWAPIVEALEDCEASTGTDTTETVVPPPPTPEVSISAGSGVTEGGNASFTVTANPAPASALSVSVSVSQTGDYGVTVGSQTVTIPTGGSYTLSVATSDDNVDEADGSVTVTVDSGTGYDVSTSNGAATVAVSDDDDPPPPPKVNATPALSISDASGGEGDTIEFTVTLSPSSSRYVWVYYYVHPAYGTAASATYADFHRAYGQLTFKPGETSKTITVTLVDDSRQEGTETFVVGLYSATQAQVADREGTGTIIDND